MDSGEAQRGDYLSNVSFERHAWPWQLRKLSTGGLGEYVSYGMQDGIVHSDQATSDIDQLRGTVCGPFTLTVVHSPRDVLHGKRYIMFWLSFAPLAARLKGQGVNRPRLLARTHDVQISFYCYLMVVI